MSRLIALLVVVLTSCGGNKTSLSTADGTVGSGGAGGDRGATGGTSGGTRNGGGFGGAGELGRRLGEILDGGLGGLINAGIVSICPDNASGQTCSGAPFCVPAGDAGIGNGCVCLQQHWFCGGGGGGLGAGDGGRSLALPPCPSANPDRTACDRLLTFCDRDSDAGRSACGCVPSQAGGLAWRCGP